jgi:hypothetical protein
MKKEKMIQKNEEILLRRIVNTILMNINEISNIGLFSDKMNIALFFYHYSRINSTQIYDKYAEKFRR